MKRDRAWLRSFLRLDSRQHEERISEASIRLQEDTVVAALHILDREPGVLLADEVGMGKTYEALGLIACVFQGRPGGGRAPRVLVVTPGQTLNHQRLRAAQAFSEGGFYRGFPENAFAEVTHITDLPNKAKKYPVVFAPVSVFTSARGRAERGFLLDLWFRARDLHGNTRRAIRQRVEDAGVKLEVCHQFLGRTADDLGDLPAAAFRARGGHAGLDDLYDHEKLDGFTNGWAVKKALDRVRFEVIRKELPPFDILMIDEAHKLKDPWTVQAQAVSHILARKFTSAVFLTATPFQLGVEELRRVFDMFGHAKSVRHSSPKQPAMQRPTGSASIASSIAASMHTRRWTESSRR